MYENDHPRTIAEALLCFTQLEALDLSIDVRFATEVDELLIHALSHLESAKLHTLSLGYRGCSASSGDLTEVCRFSAVDAILARAPYRSLQKLSLGVRMELSDMGQKSAVVGNAEQVVRSAFARCHARGVDIRVDVEAYVLFNVSPGLQLFEM
ncbi:hypothetical protein BD413DRAFT_613622 [Trametes elegans]|nr:hypothetical protein BD413DRAFT_613622 [Trametes elegans]